MKKIVALLLVSLMAISFLTSCGKTDLEDAGATTATTQASDLAYITEKGEMIIGITYFEPMNYIDKKTGELTGFETEFANEVSKILGVKATFQEIDWTTKEVELQAKRIDAIWNGMTITDERKENMSITNPYLANKQVLVVKKENVSKFTTAEAVKGISVVAEQKSAGETVINEDKFFTDVNYTSVDTMAKALLEVKSGTADACVVDYVTTIGMLGEGTDFSNLAVVDTLSFADEEYGIAFRKGSDVTAKVNEAISTLVSNGKLAEIAAKYKLTKQLIAK